MKHLENMGKVLLATGLIVVYGYTMEAFMAWYSANPIERFTFWNRAMGPYGWIYWLLLVCNLVTPQLMWFKRFRTSVAWLFFVAMVVNVGMWLERFVIVVTSLQRDFLPSSWGIYAPDLLGLRDLLRDDRPLPDPLLPVHPRAARDLDLRDADARAGSEARREGGRMSRRAPWPDGRVHDRHRDREGRARRSRRGLPQGGRLHALPDGGGARRAAPPRDPRAEARAGRGRLRSPGGARACSTTRP